MIEFSLSSLLKWWRRDICDHFVAFTFPRVYSCSIIKNAVGQIRILAKPEIRTKIGAMKLLANLIKLELASFRSNSSNDQTRISSCPSLGGHRIQVIETNQILGKTVTKWFYSGTILCSMTS